MSVGNLRERKKVNGLNCAAQKKGRDAAANNSSRGPGGGSASRGRERKKKKPENNCFVERSEKTSHARHITVKGGTSADREKKAF